MAESKSLYEPGERADWSVTKHKRLYIIQAHEIEFHQNHVYHQPVDQAWVLMG